MTLTCCLLRLGQLELNADINIHIFKYPSKYSKTFVEETMEEKRKKEKNEVLTAWKYYTIFLLVNSVIDYNDIFDMYL